MMRALLLPKGFCPLARAGLYSIESNDEREREREGEGNYQKE